MKPFRFCLIALGWVCAWVLQPAEADERIISFHSDIEVHQDGSMVVTETIRVRAEGGQIKRGIYRDFPTRYQSENGNSYTVDFNLVDVARDNGSESYHTESLSNGVRVYLGRKDFFLDPGIYSYRLTYQTNRQLGFFAAHDELYWNVTGNDWAFPIDAATARITLPPTVPSHRISVEAYTGFFGEQGQSFTSGINGLGQAEFASTRGLSPGQGLSVVVSWPKGHVTEPSPKEKMGHFIRDNRPVLIGIVGLGVLLSYYLMVWLKIGRDPPAGPIIPLFHPPAGLSPAALRYIYRMGFDNKAYTAAIINMAVKGYLTIEDLDGSYRVKRVDGENESLLSPGEIKITKALFRGKKTATFKRKHNASIRKSVKALKALLKKEFHTTQFQTNAWYLVPGFILSVLVLVLVGFSYSGETAVTLMMMSFWLTGWSFAIFMLIRQRQVLLAVVFGFFEIAAIGLFYELGSWPLLLLLICLIAVNFAFYYLVKAPTDSGRKLLDQIEGFRLYLGTAERERLNTLNPPDQTPQLFEKYLPYALALGVDQAWSERFSDKLAQESQQAGEDTYRPRWYTGSNWSRSDPSGFSSSLGSSLSSAVAASSTAPGSSSGGGGGGSSGGGGGGGGGGGW